MVENQLAASIKSVHPGWVTRIIVIAGENPVGAGLIPAPTVNPEPNAGSFIINRLPDREEHVQHPRDQRGQQHDKLRIVSMADAAA